MVSVLLRAAVAAILAAAASLGGGPAFASTYTVSPVSGSSGTYALSPGADAVTAPRVALADVESGASNFGQLVSRGLTGVAETGDVAFQRLIAMPVSEAGLNGATMNVAERILVPAAELAADAAAAAFSAPALVVAGGALALVATYQAGKWVYGHNDACPGAGDCWQKSSDTYVYTYNGNYPSPAPDAACQAFGSQFPVDFAPWWFVPATSPGDSTVVGTCNDAQFGANQWIKVSKSGTTLAPGSQVDMANDIANNTTVGDSDDRAQNWLGLANALLGHSGSDMPITGTEPASLTAAPVTVGTGSGSSTTTDSSGQITTTVNNQTTTYTPTSTGSTVNDAAIGIASTASSTATTTAPNGSTTTTTATTVNNASNQPSAVESKQCGDSSGDACFVKPTDSFTAPTLGDAKTFQQSMTDFWTTIQGSPIASAMTGISIGSGTCPTYSLPIPFFRHTYTVDAQCTIAASISGTLRTIMIAVWLVVAAGIFLRA